MTQYAFRRPEDDKSELFPLVKGDLVHDHRGDTWTFEAVSREAYGNSSGRVLVSAACEDSNGGYCHHLWHKDGMETREFFPHVFDLYLGYANGDQA
jgi:hypothetical protein